MHRGWEERIAQGRERKVEDDGDRVEEREPGEKESFSKRTLRMVPRNKNNF
jgi:hypothetical protein